MGQKPQHLLLVLCIATAVNLLAQQPARVALTGSVQDASGAVIPGARVEARFECKCSDCPPEEGCRCCPEQTSMATTTNSSGEFALSVIPGRYTITVNVPGFATKEVETNVTAGAAKRIDIKMSTGSK